MFRVTRRDQGQRGALDRAVEQEGRGTLQPKEELHP